VKEKRPSGRSAPAQRWDAFSCGGHAGCDRRRSRARRARPPGARGLSGRVRLVELHRECLECLRAQEAGTEESAEVFSALAGVGRQLAGESENVARGGAARAPERTDRLRVGDEAPPGEEEYRPDIASHGQARQPAGKRPPRRRLGALAQMKTMKIDFPLTDAGQCLLHLHWRSGRSSVKLWSSFAMPGCAPSFTPFVSATGVTPSSAKTRCGRCGAGGGRHAREGGAQRKARKRSEGQRKPSEGAWEVEGTHLAIGVADSRAVGVVRERRVRLSGVGQVLPVGLRERSARAG
jgi:hypothetical protein